MGPLDVHSMRFGWAQEGPAVSTWSFWNSEFKCKAANSTLWYNYTYTDTCFKRYFCSKTLILGHLSGFLLHF